MAKKDTKKTEPKKSDTLFEKFGEMGSAKELNMCADGFREEGDIESLKAFAVENGFTEEYAMNYIKEREKYFNAEFCNPYSAAMAKLDLETKSETEKKAAALLKSELDDLELAEGIRKKGKRLKKAFDAMREEARKIQVSGCGMITDLEGLAIMKEYYKEVV